MGWGLHQNMGLVRLKAIGGKPIGAKGAAAPPVRRGIDISGTDLLIVIRNIFIYNYNHNFLSV